MSDVAETAPSGWGLVTLIVLVVVLVGLSVAVGGPLLYRNARPDRRLSAPSAQQRLDEQFARGQLDQGEYRRLSADWTAQRARRR